MRIFLTKGLTETASFWSDVRQGYAWVRRAAHLLANDEKLSAAQVRHGYEHLLVEMEQTLLSSQPLTTMLSTFRKVTTSYWPGLFHCYDVPDLPRTNNELEQYFGSARYHERRVTGRKQASPGLVVRGAVRVVASIASRLHPFSGPELCPTDLTRWRTLRSELNHRLYWLLGSSVQKQALRDGETHPFPACRHRRVDVESDVVNSILMHERRYFHVMEKLLVWLVFSPLSCGSWVAAGMHSRLA